MAIHIELDSKSLKIASQTSVSASYVIIQDSLLALASVEVVWFCWLLWRSLRVRGLHVRIGVAKATKSFDF